jgi:hypothetical protein
VNVLELTRLGANHVRNAVAEEIYLRTGRDTTVPVDGVDDALLVALPSQIAAHVRQY